ncbi:MAG TPA: GNAT family protein [Rhizomicrobium sp.]|jgi:RimJ/RimL family protein N-acetyltransferase
MNAVAPRLATLPAGLPRETIGALADVSLRNEMVSLGPILPDDVGPVFLWLNDAQAARLDLAFRPLDWASYMAWLADLAKNPSRVFFVVRDALEPRLLGFLTLSSIHPVHRSAELGIRIGGEAQRGRGLGKAALRLGLSYAFDHLNLNRVQLTVFADNTRAIRAYEAVGFEHEGRMRHAAFIDGQWTDVLVMAALRPGSKPTLVASGGQILEPAGRA